MLFRSAGQLGGVIEELVELRVLLEVRCLEVVGPQDPQVVLDELGTLFLDDQAAGPGTQGPCSAGTSRRWP